jgi:hypothetical protein
MRNASTSPHPDVIKKNITVREEKRGLWEMNEQLIFVAQLRRFFFICKDLFKEETAT